MSMLYVLIPLALLLLGVAAWALVWAIRTGQFDDLESHAWSVVLDDDQRPPGTEDDAPPAGGHSSVKRPENPAEDAEIHRGPES